MLVPVEPRNEPGPTHVRPYLGPESWRMGFSERRRFFVCMDRDGPRQSVGPHASAVASKPDIEV